MRKMVHISDSLKIWPWAVFVVLCCAAFSWGQDTELERIVADTAWQGEVMRNQFDRMTPPGVALDQVLAPEALDLADCEPFSLELDAASLETLVVDDADVVCGIVDTGIGRESAARVVLWVEPDAWEGEDFVGGAKRRGTEGGPRSGGAGGGESDGFRVCAAGPDTNGVVFLTLTNGGTYAEAEVFAYTMTGQPVVVTNVWTNDANVVVTNVNTVWTNRSPSFRGVLGDWHWLGRVGLTNGVGVFADTMGYCDLVRFYRPVLVADSDDDGLTDGVERLVIGTDPHAPDSDGDGWSDGEETMMGTSPTNRLSAPTLARGVLLHAVRYNTAASNQFVQLYNAGRYPVRLDGFALEVAGSAYVEKFVFPLNTVLTQGHYLLLGGNGVTNADFAMVPDLPMSYSDVPTAAVRLVGPTGTTNSPVDVLMYGTHVPFNEQGLPTDGWLSTNTDLWAGPDYELIRKRLELDTDTRDNWRFATVPETLANTSDVLDSDDDGLTDEEECRDGTSPSLPDTDGDGLEDDFEIAHELDPTLPDSDGDGTGDGLETNPATGHSYAEDQLGEGMVVEIERPFPGWGMGDSIGEGGTLGFTLTEIDGMGVWATIREGGFVPEGFSYDVQGAVETFSTNIYNDAGFRTLHLFLTPETTNGFVEPVILEIDDASSGSGVTTPPDLGPDIPARFQTGMVDISTAGTADEEELAPGVFIANKVVHTNAMRSQAILKVSAVPKLPGDVRLLWTNDCLHLFDQANGGMPQTIVKCSFSNGLATNLWLEGVTTTNTVVAWASDYTNCLDIVVATVWSATCTNLWETGNPANRIFNFTLKDDMSVDGYQEIDNSRQATYGIHREKLYMAANTQNIYKVSGQVDIQPASARETCLAVIMNGTEALCEIPVPNEPDAVLHFIFEDPFSTAHATDFPLMIHVDTDGNGELDGFEPELLPIVYRHPQTGTELDAAVFGINQEKLVEHTDRLQFYLNPTLGVLPVDPGEPDYLAKNARSLLYIFVDGNTAGIRPDMRPDNTGSLLLDAFAIVDETNSCFNEWLTHQAGAHFSSSGTASVSHYQWSSQSSLANFLAARTPFALETTTYLPNGSWFETQTATGAKLEEFYESHVRPLAEQSLANSPAGSVVHLPTVNSFFLFPRVESTLFTSLSPVWVPGITCCIGNSAAYGGKWGSFLSQFIVGTDSFDEFDAAGTVGRGRIWLPRYQFAVVKEEIQGNVVFKVQSVRFCCTISDLYDFNYEDSELASHAAALQIGFGNGEAGRTAGQIFYDTIEIDVNYVNPFEQATFTPLF